MSISRLKPRRCGGGGESKSQIANVLYKCINNEQYNAN